MNYFNTHTIGCALILSASLLTGCGSSGSDDASTSQSEVSGSVFASYMQGASVSIYDTAGNLIAGPVTTNSQGRFTVKLDTAHLASALVFKSSGGEFTDEVTGAVTVGGALSTLLAEDALSGTVELSVNLTPSTTVIERLTSQHGKTLIEAQEAFENAFGFLPTPHVMPSDASTANADATNEQKLAGLRAAAFSQLNNDLGLNANQQFDLILQLADDLADDSLDGKSGSAELAIGDTSLGDDIQSKYSQSFVEFNKSPKNKTSLTNTEIGTLPFAKVALSNSYKVQYVTGMMDASEGKTVIKVKISDLEGTAQTGLTPMLMPMMNMAAHQHSTPKGSFVEDSEEAGTYIANIYFLMPSQMSSGISMGYWDIEIKIGDESAHFYPPVMMAMGDTAKVTLKNQNDKIPSMGGMDTPRSYYLFNNGLSTSGDNHDFSVVLASKESMMSFPLLNAGMTLNSNDENYELEINSISIEMSTDNNDWTVATSNGSGSWTASGLRGLSDDEDASIYVRLEVNDELKTDDGSATGNDARFFVMQNNTMTMHM